MALHSIIKPVNSVARIAFFAAAVLFLLPRSVYARHEDDNIRVALTSKSYRVSVSATSAFEVLRGEAVTVAFASRRRNLKFTASGRNISLNGRNLGPKVKIVPMNAGALVIFGKKIYRGVLVIRSSGWNRLAVINVLGLEDYLKGVVPKEIPTSYPYEAIKAQAVAARTFARYKMQIMAEKPWDLYCTARSQVYGGYSAEHYTCSQAVVDTRGMIMIYNGRLIEAYYHANCGGCTENSGDVWGCDLPYLSSRVCTHCAWSKHAHWKFHLKSSAIAGLLRKRGKSVGRIKSIRIVERTRSNRVKKVRITGTKRTRILKANHFRSIIGTRRLKSTKFGVRKHKGIYYFRGKGWGHGVGLCQDGAAGLARKKWSFDRILRFYYKGVHFARYSSLYRWKNR